MGGRLGNAIGILGSAAGVATGYGITPETFGSAAYDAIRAALPFWMIACGFVIGWFTKEIATSLSEPLLDALTKNEARAIMKIFQDGGSTAIDSSWEENILMLDGERGGKDRLFESTWTSGGRCRSDTYRLNAKTARAVAGKSTRRKIRKIAESD